jgi:hypothetical protein
LDNRYAGASDLLFSPTESQNVFSGPRPRRAVLAFVQPLPDCTRHCATSLSWARRASGLLLSFWPATATEPAKPGRSGRLIISLSAPRFRTPERLLSLRPRLSGAACQAAVAALAAIWGSSPVVRQRHQKCVSCWQLRLTLAGPSKTHVQTHVPGRKSSARQWPGGPGTVGQEGPSLQTTSWEGEN